MLALALILVSATSATAKGRTPLPPLAPTATPIQVFGAWHCGNHYCDWQQVVDLDDFDRTNRWLVERDPGVPGSPPAINLVVLSFVNPLKMLDQSDSGLDRMIPPGMTKEVVDYFKSRGIRVMLSIGGITYTDDWDAALAKDPVQLGTNAARIASALGVGIEIDYENASNPNIAALERFIRSYRSVHPYKASDGAPDDVNGLNPAARLTIDLGAGDRWLIELNRYATEVWLRDDESPESNEPPRLSYANAMVGGTASGTPTDWQEHVDGKPQYEPPVPPLQPARFTGGLYLKGNNATCLDYPSSEQAADANYVQRVFPNAAAFPTAAGYTPGMLGFMFWAAGTPSARKAYVTTTDCRGGIGAAAGALGVPVPMPVLRKK